MLERTRAWRVANPEKSRQSAKESYRRLYPLLTEEQRNRKRKYSREYARRWYAANVEKGRERGRRWRNNHLEEQRERVRRYHRQVADSKDQAKINAILDKYPDLEVLLDGHAPQP